MFAAQAQPLPSLRNMLPPEFVADHLPLPPVQRSNQPVRCESGVRLLVVGVDMGQSVAQERVLLWPRFPHQAPVAPAPAPQQASSVVHPSPASASPITSPTSAAPTAPSPNNQTFVCEHAGCGRKFQSKGSLSRHQRKHTGEKPFVCPYSGCGKVFAESSNRARHLRVHTGEKPFKCGFPGCGRRFVSSYHARRHESVHRKPDMFECERCGRLFRHEGFLNRHKCQGEK